MENGSEIKAIDVSLTGEVKSNGIVFYNPSEDGEFLKFMDDVWTNEKVIGFQWDGTKFGIIIE